MALAPSSDTTISVSDRVHWTGYFGPKACGIAGGRQMVPTREELSWFVEHRERLWFAVLSPDRQNGHGDSASAVVVPR